MTDVLRLRSIKPINQAMKEALEGAKLPPASEITFTADGEFAFLEVVASVQDRDTDEAMIAIGRREAMALIKQIAETASEPVSPAAGP